MKRLYRAVTIIRHLPLKTVALGAIIGVTSLGWAETATFSTSHTPSCTSAYKKKAVPEKTLRAIVQSHGQWLEQRYNPDYHRADLCQADLRHATLKGANLERANLEAQCCGKPICTRVP